MNFLFPSLCRRKFFDTYDNADAFLHLWRAFQHKITFIVARENRNRMRHTCLGPVNSVCILVNYGLSFVFLWKADNGYNEIDNSSRFGWRINIKTFCRTWAERLFLHCLLQNAAYNGCVCLMICISLLVNYKILFMISRILFFCESSEI